MKLAFFSAQTYEKPIFNQLNQRYGYPIDYIEQHLSPATVHLAKGYDGVVCFVNDALPTAVINALAEGGTQLIALRCAGFNQVDLAQAALRGIRVVRVPAYSPYAVAEFAVGMILDLSRKFHRAYNHVKEHNFSLNGLMGFDLHQKTVGVIGTGKIGEVFATIMQGFGCQVVAFDPTPNDTCLRNGVRYVNLEELYQTADIISLHCPLMPQTQHLINAKALQQMKPGVTLINTGRGGLIDTTAIIDALKSGQVGHLGIDVYEEEEALFFQDLSDQIIQDDHFIHLQGFPNVLITGHQAFFTQEAMHNIAETTLNNIAAFKAGEPLVNEVTT